MASVALRSDACRARASPQRRPRIEEVAARRLVEKFSVERNPRSDPDDPDPDDPDPDSPGPDDSAPNSRGSGETVAVTVAGQRHLLSRAEADELRAALGDALTERREFVRTAGTHREDGSYVVERRRADSAGHRKVFESFAALRRLYDRLPREFGADDVERSGLTGGRRHMLVHHFAEHPAFDCERVARQPLTARKRDRSANDFDAGGETDV